VGVIYKKGLAGTVNLKEAVRWYMQSAQQGYAPAQYNLAVAYDTGSGIQHNLQEAMKWYTKAAKQGIALAKEQLRLIHHDNDRKKE